MTPLRQSPRARVIEFARETLRRRPLVLMVGRRTFHVRNPWLARLIRLAMHWGWIRHA